MFEPPYNDTLDVVTYELDDDSAYVETGRTTVECVFRHINRVDALSHQRVLDSDAIIRCPLGAPIVIGSLIDFHGEQYKVDRVVPAQGLMTTPQHIRGELTRTTWAT